MQRSADSTSDSIGPPSKKARREGPRSSLCDRKPTDVQLENISSADSTDTASSSEDSVVDFPDNDPAQYSSEDELWFCGSGRPPPWDLEHCAVLTPDSRPSDPPSALPRIRYINGKAWASLNTKAGTDLEVMKQYVQSLGEQILVLWDARCPGASFIVQCTAEQLEEMGRRSWCEEIWGYGDEDDC